MFTFFFQDGCSIINPGSFGKNEFSFKTYIMKTKLVEDSQIPDEDEWRVENLKFYFFEWNWNAFVKYIFILE